MSIGTIVVVVLAMTMLILGLILIRAIFTSSTTSITQIDNKVKDAINNIFVDDDARTMVVYPSDYKISIKQGNPSSGFAFSVRNTGLDDADFEYVVAVDPNFDIFEKCHMEADVANSWLVAPEGSFSLAGSTKMENPELVLFSIPVDAKTCTIPYKVDVTKESQYYAQAKVYVTIAPK